jgi:hypothetical protein
VKKEVEITGKVYKKVFAEGSKSEHMAVFIGTKSGEYKLQLENGNPFFDSALYALDGKTITAKGTQVDYLFIIKKFTVIG